MRKLHLRLLLENQFGAGYDRPAVLFLGVVLVCAISFARPTAAQSGRRQSSSGKSPSPVTTSTTPTDPAKPASKPTVPPAATVHIMMDENFLMNLPGMATHIVYDAFFKRLKESTSLVVSAGGKGDRKLARERAKTEKETHVALIQLDEQMPGRMTSNGQVDLGNLAVKYYVFAPQTATLKTQGSVPMRPYRATGSVGGVRLPLPSGRTTALEYILEQAGRDAADRVMAAFHLRPPSEL